MYKLCVAFVAVLAIAAAKPNVGYPYSSAYSVPAVYGEAPVAASYSYSSPGVYNGGAHSAYSPSAYSAAYPAAYPSAYPSYNYAQGTYAPGAARQAYSAYPAYPAYTGYSGYSSPLTYGSAYSGYSSPLTYGSAYPGYSAPLTYGSAYSGYQAPLTYGSTYGELPLWKKK